jgi:hypothetical protein
MPVDEALLERLRSYEDPRLGVREEFLRPTLGGRSTVAVLARPLGPARSMGWVLCHSLGQEFFHLSRFDVTISRAMAAAGFPVLRYHGQGYGDSEGGADSISLDSHLREATEAVALMAAQDGVGSVGTMGARFGGLVAAIVADQQGLPLTALWEPVTKGSQYMRNFLRTRLFAEWAGTMEGGGVEELLQDLETKGSADIKGFLLTKEAYDQISAIDLRKELTRFRGSALVTAITRGESPGPGLVKLVDHFRSLGATCDLEVLQDELAAELGSFHYRTEETARTDTQFELNEAVASTTVAWAERRADGVAGTREDGQA